MPNAPIHLLLEDISLACEKVFKYSKGFSKLEITANSEKFEAIVYNLQIIGEASNKLPTDFKANNTSIPLRNIIDMRHRLVHDYSGINVEIVLSIVFNDLNKFHNEIEKLRNITSYSAIHLYWRINAAKFIYKS